jgi:CheY-like chemotaxis protein
LSDEASPALHIWVVDDDPDLRQLLAEVLDRQGYEVRCLNDGGQLLSWLQRHRSGHTPVTSKLQAEFVPREPGSMIQQSKEFVLREPRATSFGLAKPEAMVLGPVRSSDGGRRTGATMVALVVGMGGLLSCVLLGIGLLSLSGGSAYAQLRPGEAGSRWLQAMPKLTPEQQKKLFPGRKELVLKEHQQRITLLQKSQSCVGAATNSDALKACLMEERRANTELRRRMHDQIREFYERNGIKLPPMGPPPERRGEAGGV